MFYAQKVVNKKGFTLVELLVVISIVSVLSSTVLAAVNSTRQKARSAANNELIGQYRLAIEFAADAVNGVYPKGADTNWHCLGDYPDNRCGLSSIPGGNYTEDPVLTNAIKPYIPSLPTIPMISAVGVLERDFEGPILGCAFSGSPPVCTGRVIWWYQRGIDQSCGIGYAMNDGSATNCLYWLLP